MAQTKPVWEQIGDFNIMASQLIEKYPERFGKIDPDWIIAYGIVNKDKPAAKTKPFDMSGIAEPESFTNSKKYFVKLYLSDWEARDDSNKLWIVFSALERLDRDEPDNGKVGGFDYKDLSTLVRTLGADWDGKGNLPNLLTQDVNIVDEPISEVSASLDSSGGFEEIIEQEVNI